MLALTVMHHLDPFYLQWHRQLTSALDERGAAADLARFLCPPDTDLAGYRVWVSQIKNGKKRPDGTIMAAIYAWMHRRGVGCCKDDKAA